MQGSFDTAVPAVAVKACDDEIIPSQKRVAAVGEDADLQEVHDTERNLLYVDRTCSRSAAGPTRVDPASESLGDLQRSSPSDHKTSAY